MVQRTLKQTREPPKTCTSFFKGRSSWWELPRWKPSLLWTHGTGASIPVPLVCRAHNMGGCIVPVDPRLRCVKSGEHRLLPRMTGLKRDAVLGPKTPVSCCPRPFHTSSPPLAETSLGTSCKVASLVLTLFHRASSEGGVSCVVRACVLQGAWK